MADLESVCFVRCLFEEAQQCEMIGMIGWFYEIWSMNQDTMNRLEDRGSVNRTGGGNE